MNMLEPNENTESHRKETEDMKKNQMEMLEWKNTVIKTKNLLDRLNGILTENQAVLEMSLGTTVDIRGRQQGVKEEEEIKIGRASCRERV